MRILAVSIAGIFALCACGGSPETKVQDYCQDIFQMIPAQCDCFDVNMEQNFDVQTAGKAYEAFSKVSDELSVIQSMRSVELDQRTISDILTLTERCKMDSSWGAAGSN